VLFYSLVNSTSVLGCQLCLAESTNVMHFAGKQCHIFNNAVYNNNHSLLSELCQTDAVKLEIRKFNAILQNNSKKCQITKQKMFTASFFENVKSDLFCILKCHLASVPMH